MKTHQFERLEALLSDILEELKANRLLLQHPPYTIRTDRDLKNVYIDESVSPDWLRWKHIDLPEISKNICGIDLGNSSASESDSKAG